MSKPHPNNSGQPRVDDENGELAPPSAQTESPPGRDAAPKAASRQTLPIRQPHSSGSQITRGPTEDMIFAPRIDTTVLTNPSQLWATVVPASQRRPQKDDEDSDTEGIPPALDRSDMNAAAGVKIPSRVRTRDPWGRSINVDDKPVDYDLPTRDRGAVDYIVKEPKFNGSLGVGGSSTNAQRSVAGRCGLRENEKLSGELMKEAGLDPCAHTNDGELVREELLRILPGREPPPTDEPVDNFRGGADFDFGSIEMLLTGDPNKQSVVKILPSAIPSPVGVGPIPDGNLTPEWQTICGFIIRQEPEIAASWWLAHLAYYLAANHAYYDAIRPMIDCGMIPREVLDSGGLPLPYTWDPLIKEFHAEEVNKEERLANTFWTPKIKDIDGFPHYWWHPREGFAELDTRFRPVPALQGINVPEKETFNRIVRPEKLMWDGIPGHTFRLPPYRFFDCYVSGSHVDTPEYAYSDMAIDIRRIPVKGKLRDISKDKYDPTCRNYEVKPLFSSANKGQELRSGKDVIEGEINYAAIADEIDPWGPPGGGEGRDYDSELQKDFEGRYQYFIVNNDPHKRSLVVNGTFVERGRIAGPLPTFAIIEFEGNFGFWHGHGGTFYDFKTAHGHFNENLKDWGVHDSDGSDDDWRGDDRGGPKKMKTNGPLHNLGSGRFPLWMKGRPHRAPSPPRFKMDLPVRKKADYAVDDNKARPTILGKEYQEAKRNAETRDPNDVFDDDIPMPDWANQPPPPGAHPDDAFSHDRPNWSGSTVFENGARRPAAPLSPLPELLPIEQNEFSEDPMAAIRKFVAKNRAEREKNLEGTIKETVEKEEEKIAEGNASVVPVEQQGEGAVAPGLSGFANDFSDVARQLLDIPATAAKRIMQSGWDNLKRLGTKSDDEFTFGTGDEQPMGVKDGKMPLPPRTQKRMRDESSSEEANPTPTKMPRSQGSQSADGQALGRRPTQDQTWQRNHLQRTETHDSRNAEAASNAPAALDLRNAKRCENCLKKSDRYLYGPSEFTEVKDGKTMTSTKCRSCRRQLKEEEDEKRKQEEADNQSCLRCGGVFPVLAFTETMEDGELERFGNCIFCRAGDRGEGACGNGSCLRAFPVSEFTELPIEGTDEFFRLCKSCWEREKRARQEMEHRTKVPEEQKDEDEEEEEEEKEGVCENQSCGRRLPISEFTVVREDGRISKLSRCKSCREGEEEKFICARKDCRRTLPLSHFEVSRNGRMEHFTICKSCRDKGKGEDGEETGLCVSEHCRRRLALSELIEIRVQGTKECSRVCKTCWEVAQGELPEAITNFEKRCKNEHCHDVQPVSDFMEDVGPGTMEEQMWYSFCRKRGKRCRNCKRVRPHSKFFADLKDGTTKEYKQCESCRDELDAQARERKEKRRQKAQQAAVEDGEDSLA